MQLLSDAAERLWYRMITSVDDFGRMEADPEVVFTSCFQKPPKGWTFKKVESCLQELATFRAPQQDPVIVLYQVGHKRYLQLTSADVHIYRRAEKSKYPAPVVLESPHPLTPQELNVVRTCAQLPADSLESRVPNSDSPESRTSNPDLRAEKRGDEPTLSGQALKALEAFTVTAELEAWAAKEGIDNPAQYLEEFKDYWRSCGCKRKNGQFVKDWAAAFRNRLRMLKDQGKLKKPSVWS